jgi:flagellar biogenesis protein FliO
MSDLSLSLIRAVASLSFTLALIVLVGWAWKRYGQGVTTTLTAPRTASRLRKTESLRLSQTTTLHLIQLDDTEHLIATTGQQTTVLHTQKKKLEKKSS